MSTPYEVDKHDDLSYGFDMSGIFTQAKRNKSLRDSGLFAKYPYLEDAILIAVIHHVYVVYKRETPSYFFIDRNDNAKLLKVISDTDKLNIDSLVEIVESLMPEGAYHGRKERSEAVRPESKR
jgi:hypothetical protein